MSGNPDVIGPINICCKCNRSVVVAIVIYLSSNSVRWQPLTTTIVLMVLWYVRWQPLTTTVSLTDTRVIWQSLNICCEFDCIAVSVM